MLSCPGLQTPSFISNSFSALIYVVQEPAHMKYTVIVQFSTTQFTYSNTELCLV